MDRKRMITIAVGAGAILAVAALVLVGAERRAQMTRAVPAWLNPKQPPDGIAPDLPTVSEAAGWATARPPHFAGACDGYTAGRRVRRTYAPTLMDSPGSFIRAGVNLEGGV